MRVAHALAVAAMFWSGLAVTQPTLALAQPALGTVRLEWTATGDDGESGTAHAYDIRYYALPLAEYNFSMGQRILLAPRPDAAGTRQTLTISGLNPGMKYYFAIKVSDEQGNWSPISNVVSKVVGWAVDAPMPEGAPLAFSAPRPNPARGAATFDFGLPENRPVSVEVFDVGGRRVRRLELGTLEAGRHATTWDLRDDGGRAVGAGLYLVRGTLGGDRFTRRVTVVR